MFISKYKMYILALSIMAFIFLIGVLDRTVLLKYQMNRLSSSETTKIGIGIKEIHTKISNSNKKIVIVDILPDSPAMKLGLRKGDIITAINGNIIRDKQQVKNLINQTPKDAEISLSIFRGGQNRYLLVKISKMTKNRHN